MNKKVIKLLGSILVVSFCLSFVGCASLAYDVASDVLKSSKEDITHESLLDAEEETEITEREEVSEEERESIEESEEVNESAEDNEEVSESVEETETETESMAVTEHNADLSDDIYSFQFSFNGELYTLPMTFADFEASGWVFKDSLNTQIPSNRYVVSQFWEKDGIKIYSKIANLSSEEIVITEGMVAEVNFTLYNFRDSDAVVELPCHIVLGVSTLEDITNAYGTPSSELDLDSSYIVTYSLDMYEEVKLKIDKETGKLNDITITNMISTE